MRIKKAWIIVSLGLGVVAIIVWLFVRPLPYFVVTKNFERPIDTSNKPALFKTLRAEECGACHPDFLREWSTTIHSQAWKDPYFQADWKFENEPQICRNCHTPLDRQQPDTVLGFRDSAKWDPILEANPDFDVKLQHEGVTCAVCHLHEDKILGPYGDNTAPHPVKKMENSNQVCVRCHVVNGERWDTFMRIPPCGTVAEINESCELKQGKEKMKRSGETAVPSLEKLGCVECHMPMIERPIVAGGQVRKARQHLWRGGHDPEMVKQGLAFNFEQLNDKTTDSNTFQLTMTNVGATHYLPTGTPDRHLTVEFRLVNADGQVIKEQNHKLIRNILWRPFIIDLSDSRLRHNEPRYFQFEIDDKFKEQALKVTVMVRYHLLEESRRKRINYKNVDPISYSVFQEKISID